MINNEHLKPKKEPSDCPICEKCTHKDVCSYSPTLISLYKETKFPFTIGCKFYEAKMDPSAFNYR